MPLKLAASVTLVKETLILANWLKEASGCMRGKTSQDQGFKNGHKFNLMEAAATSTKVAHNGVCDTTN